MKLFNALAEQAKRKDNTPMERFEYNKVRVTIEAQCTKYLQDRKSVV